MYLTGQRELTASGLSAHRPASAGAAGRALAGGMAGVLMPEEYEKIPGDSTAQLTLRAAELDGTSEKPENYTKKVKPYFRSKSTFSLKEPELPIIKEFLPSISSWPSAKISM